MKHTNPMMALFDAAISVSEFGYVLGYFIPDDSTLPIEYYITYDAVTIYEGKIQDDVESIYTVVKNHIRQRKLNTLLNE